MRIIGCDLHTRQQTLAMLDTTTGEVVNRTLMHEGSEVREFYFHLPRPVLVGIEAIGPMQWFLNLLEELDNGELERSRKNVLVRGLNRNCNHDLKNLFKGAAVIASSKPGPFEQFYVALVAKGMRPEMARLTLAEKNRHDRIDRMEEGSVLRRP